MEPLELPSKASLVSYRLSGLAQGRYTIVRFSIGSPLGAIHEPVLVNHESSTVSMKEEYLRGQGGGAQVIYGSGNIFESSHRLIAHRATTGEDLQYNLPVEDSY